LVALLLAIQMTSALSSGFTDSTVGIVSLVAMSALTITIPLKTRAACTLIPLFWSLAQMVPGFDGAPYMITVYSAVASLFVYYSIHYAAAVLTGTSALLLIEGLSLSAQHPTLRSEVLCATLVSILGLVISALLGLGLKQWQENANAMRAKAEINAQRERMMHLQRDTLLASRLHDGLTNDLSYLMLLATDEADNADTPQQRATWHKVIVRTDEAFTKAHDIIDLLNSSSETVGDSLADKWMTGQTSEIITTEVFAEQLHAVTEQGKADIKELGYLGLTTVSVTGHNGIPQPVADETVNLINELFANIRRHCDTEEDYSLEVNLDNTAITVTQMNSLNRTQHHTVIGRSGRGLRMHHKSIKALGGGLTTASDGDVWMIRAIIPLQPAHPVDDGNAPRPANDPMSSDDSANNDDPANNTVQ
jgi:hypothetical protein